MIKIGGLEKTTLIDFPGKVACTVFCLGCNFRCPFCYNSELVLPEKIKKQPKISEKYFFEFLKKRKGLIDGVVLTGGEPTIYKDLPCFAKKIKKFGCLIKLDTNGANPAMLKCLIDKKLIDYAAMDVKAPLNAEIQNSKDVLRGADSKAQKYNEATGVKVDLNKIKKSIEIIKNSGVDYEFRMTAVPTIHAKEDIVEIAKWIGPAKKFFLQNFRPEKTVDARFKKIKPFPKEFLLEVKKEISEFFDVCEIRG